MKIRTQLKAGRFTNVRANAAGVAPSSTNHNETLQRQTERADISMRRELKTTTRRQDRLELLVVRAGLRAGRRMLRRGRDRR